MRMTSDTNAKGLSLAIDTSTDMLACAVVSWEPGAAPRVLAARDHMCRRQANVELATTVLAALEDCGRTMADLDRVLVGRGPGSFTGVRIGIATAKGLSCGLSRPLHGVSVLDATAWAVWKAGVRGLLGVADDAMRGEVYPGVYQLDDAGAHRTFATETVCKADECVAAWSARGDAARLVLAGNGLKKYRARFEAAGFESILDEGLWYPTGEGLALAAAASPLDSGDPALVLPIYTRLSDAEENERKRLGLKAPASVEVTGVDDALADRHLQLRPMSVNDLPAVAALEAAAFSGSSHTPWTERLFYEEL
ncbi:MAG: tRNA (adenosine(37)-N6)-threonylcarbamoyltransferase complex dimerization subunit type 1 TsaB, partial [Coriobacteriaceae bacterium]|nr:tRNA (adenosine(37)-N6)-threonylcarbamoyltransferase complex dimerization subunit type 1 TsaB [Coriobacteriaceae bacterium]